jgi:hypothetical protein
MLVECSVEWARECSLQEVAEKRVPTLVHCSGILSRTSVISSLDHRAMHRQTAITSSSPHPCNGPSMKCAHSNRWQLLRFQPVISDRKVAAHIAGSKCCGTDDRRTNGTLR